MGAKRVRGGGGGGVGVEREINRPGTEGHNVSEQLDKVRECTWKPMLFDFLFMVYYHT